MRVVLVAFALAFAVPRVALSAPAPSSSSRAARQIVVQIAASDRSPAVLSAWRAGLTARFATLGLSVAGRMDDGMPTGRDAGRSGAASVSPRAPRDPFAFDPARVWLLEAPDPAGASAALLALARDPEIEWAEPNRPRGPAMQSLGAAFPNDPMFRDTRQWGLHNVGPSGVYGGVAGADVHALEAWGWTTGSNALRLAVADTGIDPDHPDLQAVIPGVGMRLVLATNVANDPSGSYADSLGHGTACAGIMAALTNNGALHDTAGVAGVCGGDGHGNLGCQIVPIKMTVGRDGAATSYDIGRAVLYATRAGARAVNLSFGGFSPSRVERQALLEAITHGCVAVVAAGNAGINAGDRSFYPAAYAAENLCIQVGASDPKDQRVNFSSHGLGLDLVAPGTRIWTTLPTYFTAGVSSYAVGDGTSFAAPFVTGAVGLLAALRPELTDDDFQHVIRESADDIGAPGIDNETGWGRLNVARALSSVRPEFGIWHDEVAADHFIPLRRDSLRVTEGGMGNLDRARIPQLADLIEASATVAIPDSFLDSVRVWSRVGGTTTISGDFHLPYFTPWATVDLGAADFTVHGYVYHLVGCPTCVTPEDAFLPLPPDQARFGFTMIGRVDRAPALRVRAPVAGASVADGDTIEATWSATDPDRVTAFEIWIDRPGAAPVRLARLPGDATRARVPVLCSASGTASLRVVALDEHGRHHDQTAATVPLAVNAGPCASAPRLAATPNPFRGSTLIAAPASAMITIVDVAGRVRRRVDPADPGASRTATGYAWDGRDDRGVRVSPGIYLVRCEGPAGRAERKVIRLE